MKTAIDPTVEEALENLATMRVFFGHQSIGMNILDGIAEISLTYGRDVAIRSIEEQGDSTAAQILEAYIGRNEHPDEKIAEFAATMRSGIADTVDMAFMKFCYVDSGKQMSADEIFSEYVAEMERLEAEYPDTEFVYVTMPLTSPGRTAKNLVRRVLRRPISGRESNIERNRFNDLLREAKAQTGRLFDLAAIESTRPDGGIEAFTSAGETYAAMVSAYTDDGGHLNETGRGVVAQQLLLFLADLNNRAGG